MNFWSLTLEKKNELLKKVDEKQAELQLSKKKSLSDLWTEDLDALLAKVNIRILFYFGFDSEAFHLNVSQFYTYS